MIMTMMIEIEKNYSKFIVFRLLIFMRTKKKIVATTVPSGVENLEILSYFFLFRNFIIFKNKKKKHQNEKNIILCEIMIQRFFRAKKKFYNH